MPTTNPIPSTDPSDLLFNAGKLDEVVNGAANSFTDRLGVARRTVAGMNADFDAQLADAESDLNVYRADAAASAAEALGYLQTIRATSYGAYASDPATDPLGNPPTVGDEYFNTTANLLKRWNGTTWQASDINTANLAASSGSSLVGYDGGTVQDVLDGAKSLQDYAALRAYTGRATRIYITGLLVTAKPAGIAGVFQYDPTDTTSADNNATIIVGADGRRWKRDYSGSVHVGWFGAVGTGLADDTLALQKCFDYAETLRLQNSSVSVTVEFASGAQYLVSSTVVARNISIDGNGAKIVTDENINILRVEGNVHVFEDFHCWYLSPKNNPNAIAIKLTNGTGQASKNTWIGVTTRNAYIGFYNLKTGPAAADGSIFGTVFINCRADYCYDWGWYCKTGGGTTLTLTGCNANGTREISPYGGKGYYFEDFGDIVLNNCSADLLPDGNALVTVNCSSIQIDTFAVESCGLKTANSKMVSFTTATYIKIGCILQKVTTIDVGAGNSAYIVWLSTCLTNDIGQISSQFQTLTSGTLYKLRSSGTGRTRTNFVPKSDVNTFGVDQNFFDFGRFVGLTSGDPSTAFTDAHTAGDIALRTPPVQGIELGWVCIASGTPGTWLPFGQVGVMTSIGATPRYVGQLAVVGGIGYLATGTSSSTDWKQITN